MESKTNVIIGISPGTRYITIVILVGTELRDWRERAFHGPWSEMKLTKISAVVKSLLDFYRPRAVAFKPVHRSRSSPALEQVTSELMKLATENTQTPYVYTSGQLIATLLHKQRADRKDLINLLVRLYPTLLPLATRETILNRPYHWRLFDALGCALACSRMLELQDSRTPRVQCPDNI
jgi:hypothetical protein